MAAERIIGVDFGTSTSVIRVKRYQDGKPVGDRLEVRPVKFNMGKSEIVPTLIQKLPTGDAYFGYEAEIKHGRATTETFQNFKINIDSPNETIRQQARELTTDFFEYLAKTYKGQSDGSHLGEIDDRQRTIISYPVKWSNDAKDFMVRTAKGAGFPNVEGIDEAQAAIQAVTVQNADLLTGKGYFKSGVPVNILLIDMGAGTTDLVLCRHIPGTQPKTDILSTWPQGGDALFGGREVDELLKSFISQEMPEDSADIVLKKIGIEKYKAWKEDTVSPALEKGESVDYFSALDTLLNLMGIDAEYSIDRDGFETHAADYLRPFPELVSDCLKNAGINGNDVDLVVLTGGHSQWYFVREMLSGKLDRFGKIGLGKIQADPRRIILISLPQETVALGLAYMPLKMEGSSVPQPIKDDKKAPSIVVAKETIRADDATQEDVFPLKYDPYSRIRSVIAAGGEHTVGLKENGSVIATGWRDEGRCNVNAWRSIVAVAAGGSHTVGLREDGTVIAVGNNGDRQCNVNDWCDIVAIAAGGSHTIGLKKDGTVVAAGDRLLSKKCKVGVWRNIVAISAGSDHTVGLKEDGTVVAVGDWDKLFGQCKVEGWRDIVAISAGERHTIGLKKDGTVVTTGDNAWDKCKVGDWRDIVAISAGRDHTVGLKEDGTVIAVGCNNSGECNVNDWRDIAAIATGDCHTIGLKKDGTVIAVGLNHCGQTNVGKYKTSGGLFGLFSKTTEQTPWKLF